MWFRLPGRDEPCLELADGWFLDVRSGEHLRSDSDSDAPEPAEEPEVRHRGEYRVNLFKNRFVATGPDRGRLLDRLCDALCRHGQESLVSHWTCCGAHEFHADCAESRDEGQDGDRDEGQIRLSKIKAFTVMCMLCMHPSAHTFTTLIGGVQLELCPSCLLDQEDEKTDVCRGMRLTQPTARWTCRECKSPKSPTSKAYWSEEQKESVCLRCMAGHSGVFRDTSQFKAWDAAQERVGQWSWCGLALGHCGSAACSHIQAVVCLPHWTCCGSQDPGSRACMPFGEDPDTALLNRLLRRLLEILDLGPAGVYRSKLYWTSASAGIAELKDLVRDVMPRFRARASFRLREWRADFSTPAVCVAGFAMLACWLAAALHPDSFLLEPDQEDFLSRCRAVVDRVPALGRYLELRLAQLRQGDGQDEQQGRYVPLRALEPR
jgi:hypothetical protein